MHKKKRAIASARAFLGMPFDVLAEIAVLNPKDDWHQWEDPEGNRLRIAKNKAVQVYPAKQTTSTKDIFRKAQPALIAKHSYWALALFGHNKTLLNFLGNDGVLRCCYFEQNVWQYNMSAVLLGFKPLRYICSGYIENKARRITSLKIRYPRSFEIEEAWGSGYPTSDSKLQERMCHLINQESVG
jgi:hypothetical protein